MSSAQEPIWTEEVSEAIADKRTLACGLSVALDHTNFITLLDIKQLLITNNIKVIVQTTQSVSEVAFQFTQLEPEDITVSYSTRILYLWISCTYAGYQPYNLTTILHYC